MRSDMHIVSRQGGRASLAIAGACVALVARRGIETRSGALKLERVDTEVKPN